MAKKFLLVYAGPGYTGDSDPTRNYTTANMQKLVRQSGATDLLFLSIYPINHINASTEIITANYIDTKVTDFDTGAETSDGANNIKNGMKASVTNQAQWASYQNAVNYVTEMVKWAKNFIAQDTTGQIKVWFGLPVYLFYCHAAARVYNDVFVENIIKPIESQMAAAGLSSRIGGYYFSQEHIPSGYSRFDAGSPAVNYNCPTVQNMAYVKSKLPANRQFLWIPFYRHKKDGLTADRTGRIINQRPIFDIAILQSSYYFKPTEVCDDPSYGVPNVDLVANCATSNACKYHNGTVVGGSKTSSTQIGVEMEVDSQVATDTSQYGYLYRYNVTVSKFAKFINSTPKPVAFYASDPKHIVNDAVFAKIKAFFLP